MKRKKTVDEDDVVLSVKKIDDDVLPAKKIKRTLKHHLSDLSRLELLLSNNADFSSIASSIPSLIFGHSQFSEIIHDTKYGPNVKLAVLKILATAMDSTEFEAGKEMKEEHVPQILGGYNGTLNEIDQTIFSILRAYECKGRIDFSRFYPLTWGQFGLRRYASLKSLGPALWNRPTADDVLNCLDTRLMKESCHRLPLQITLDTVPAGTSPDVYDPRFLLPLFHVLLAPHTLMDARRFAIEKWCLGYTLSCLSLHNRSLRGLAYAILFRFRHHIRDQSTPDVKKRFRERPQILYILNLLRQSTDRPLERIPSLSACFLSRAIQLTAMPSNALYSPVNSYLLLKPKLDLWDVPEFYKLFQGSVAERFWILNLIAGGLRESADYRICERRNAFKLLFAFHDWAAYSNSPEEDDARREVLKIIVAACHVEQAAFDLCYRYNLMGWISGAVHSIKTVDDARELATILSLIRDSVLKKESVPEYVRMLWRAGVCVLKERASKLPSASQLLKDEAWTQFIGMID